MKEKFNNQFCSFIPYCYINLENIIYPVTFKVVTENLQSLGLRRNPNIITFTPYKWITLPESSTLPGKYDWGGIWSTLRLSSARVLKNYMEDKHGLNARIYFSAIDNPLFSNSYRIKSQGILLIEEI